MKGNEYGSVIYVSHLHWLSNWKYTAQAAVLLHCCLRGKIVHSEPEQVDEISE